MLVSVQAGYSVQTARKKSPSAKSSSAKSKKAAAEAQKNAQAKRKLGHIKRAFVASADLRPMAQQLLENRTPQAYQGVEAYARKHAKDDAGPLAWIVVGYAHYLDKDFVSARSAWVRAKSLEPLLGDYLEDGLSMFGDGIVDVSDTREGLDNEDEPLGGSPPRH